MSLWAWVGIGAGVVLVLAILGIRYYLFHDPGE